MFGLRKKTVPGTMSAPVSGRLIPMGQVSDPVFSQKMMGDGFAVKPENGDLYSPVAGKVTTVFPTKHALGITTDDGIEILMHIGIDTVELEGKPFEIYVKPGDKVKNGSKIGTMDLNQLQQAQKDDTVIVIITNMDKVQPFEAVSEREVHHKDNVLALTTK